MNNPTEPNEDNKIKLVVFGFDENDKGLIEGELSMEEFFDVMFGLLGDDE